jgi:hypothetical protein
VAYLEAASKLARGQWTQFDTVSMLAGLSVLAATVALQSCAVWLTIDGYEAAEKAASSDNIGEKAAASRQAFLGARLSGKGQLQVYWEWGTEGMAVVMGIAYAVSLFSDSFVLAEGRALRYGIATLTLCVLRSTLSLELRRTALRHKQPAQSPDVGAVKARSAHPSGRRVDGCRTSVEVDMTGQGAVAHDADPGSDQHRAGEAGAHVLATAWLGAALLVLNWFLGAYGLVERSSHDAMWKTGATATATALAGGWFQSWFIQPLYTLWGPRLAAVLWDGAVTYVPLALIPWGLLRSRKCRVVPWEPWHLGKSPLGRASASERALVIAAATAYCSIGLHWLAEAAFPDKPDATLGNAASAIGATASGLAPAWLWGAARAALRLLWESGGRRMWDELGFGAVADVWVAVSGVRLRLLLPRMAYAAAGVVGALAIAASLRQSGASARMGSHSVHLVTGLAVALMAAYLLVLGKRWPVAVLAAVAQAGCLLRLLAIRLACCFCAWLLQHLLLFCSDPVSCAAAMVPCSARCLVSACPSLLGGLVYRS